MLWTIAVILFILWILGFGVISRRRRTNPPASRDRDRGCAGAPDHRSPSSLAKRVTSVASGREDPRGESRAGLSPSVITRAISARDSILPWDRAYAEAPRCLRSASTGDDRLRPVARVGDPGWILVPARIGTRGVLLLAFRIEKLDQTIRSAARKQNGFCEQRKHGSHTPPRS